MERLTRACTCALASAFCKGKSSAWNGNHCQHPVKWLLSRAVGSIIFLGGCARGAVNFTNELQKERKKEASLMDRYWWRNLFCPGIIHCLFVRRGCAFIVTGAYPGGWDRGISLVVLCEIASVISYTNSWSVWGVKHGESLIFCYLSA